MKKDAAKSVQQELQLEQVAGGAALMPEMNEIERVALTGCQNSEFLPSERSDLNEGQKADYRRIAEQRRGKRSQPR